MILDLQCSLQNAKDRSEQGRKLSPVFLLISGWKRYFYRQGKIKIGTGKDLKALQCLHFFFLPESFSVNVQKSCRNLLDKRGNAKWPENEVQWTKKSTTTSTENLHRQHIAPLRWIKSDLEEKKHNPSGFPQQTPNSEREEKKYINKSWDWNLSPITCGNIKCWPAVGQISRSGATSQRAVGRVGFNESHVNVENGQIFMTLSESWRKPQKRAD